MLRSRRERESGGCYFGCWPLPICPNRTGGYLWTDGQGKMKRHIQGIYLSRLFTTSKDRPVLVTPSSSFPGRMHRWDKRQLVTYGNIKTNKTKKHAYKRLVEN